jgi:glycosyltransferase involved in cell wall biosynthesis
VSGLACFRDFVRDGETGLVFDHTSPAPADALAAQLATLLADSDLRRRLARNAQAEVQRFDFAECARAVLAQFARLAPPSGV